MHILGSKDNNAVNTYGHKLQKQMIEVFHSSVAGLKHGTFIDSCNHHCFGCSETEDTWNGPNVVSTKEKLTPATALKQWYEISVSEETGQSSTQRREHVYYQDYPFPCDDCCKCTW